MILLICFALSTHISAQTTSNKTNPDWDFNADWSITAPDYDTNQDAILAHDSDIDEELIINDAVTINVDKTLTTSNAIIIKDGGTLTIDGTVILTDEKFLIESNGTLVVNGL